MTLRCGLVRALDRRGSRKILGLLATWYARHLTGEDVSIFHDGGWMHRLGGEYMADGLSFGYYEDTVRAWPSRHRATFDNVVDHWFHVYRPKSGDVIVDVGAGVGPETPVFSRMVGPTGRVYAVEAHPTTFRRLEAVCRWNRLENVILRQCAVVDAGCSMYIEDRLNHQSDSVKRTPGHGDVSAAIPGISLDELCDRLGVGHVDFLKMNIEGAERDAIRGMRNVIRRTEHLCIACHDFRGEVYRSKQEVLDFLRENDFDVVTREADSRPWVRDHVHGTNRALGHARNELVNDETRA